MGLRPFSGLIAALVALTAGLPAAAAPPRLVVTHRLADERAAAKHLADAPTATVAYETRYVLVEPVVLPVPLPALPVAGPDGVLALPLPCPERFAGHECVLSVVLPTKSRTHAERVQCPAAGGPPVTVRIPGLVPGEELLTVVNALGSPERVTSEVLVLPPGARLRVSLALVGTRPLQANAPVRFRVTAEGEGKPAPVAVLDRTLDVTRTEDREWVDLDLPLDAARTALGGKGRLVFHTDVPDAAGGFPVWGDPTVLVPAGARDRPPWNVLLVSLDTLRADRLGCSGNPRATSPTLDRLAREGTFFPLAIAPSSWTLPSHASLMTGLYACAHGLVTPQSGQRFAPGTRPLAALLRARGYLTAAFTEDAFLEPSVFQPGFGTYRADAYATNRTKVEATVGAAGAWLRANAQSPFLLFVHTYQTHSPYNVPVSYRQLFTTYDTPEGPRPLGGAPGNLQELGTYDTAIRYTDDVFATLLATMKDVGLDRHTIVVVVSDHGEAFWEHGHSGHGKALYEEDIRVPFIWWAPGLIAAGRRGAGPVGLHDVLPTLADLLGFEQPAAMQGQNLAPQVRAAAPAGAGSAERVVFSETSKGGYQLAARAARWKALVAGDASPQFFDLERDPGEQHPDATAPFADATARERAHFDAECTRAKAALAAAAPTAPLPPPPAPDPAREKNLRALGYVQ
jgi:arylsulfatase A-like enzyme